MHEVLHVEDDIELDLLALSPLGRVLVRKAVLPFFVGNEGSLAGPDAEEFAFLHCKLGNPFVEDGSEPGLTGLNVLPLCLDVDVGALLCGFWPGKNF